MEYKWPQNAVTLKNSNHSFWSWIYNLNRVCQGRLVSALLSVRWNSLAVAWRMCSQDGLLTRLERQGLASTWKCCRGWRLGASVLLHTGFSRLPGLPYLHDSCVPKTSVPKEERASKKLYYLLWPGFANQIMSRAVHPTHWKQVTKASPTQHIFKVKELDSMSWWKEDQVIGGYIF